MNIIRYNNPLSKITPLCQGMRWDAVADTYTRTGSISDISTGQSALNANLPVHSLMRRCVVNDNRTINYFIDPLDPTKKEGGGDADYSGADGQVMVYVPKFYYARVYSGNIRGWAVSLYPLPGFSVFPSFIGNGKMYKNIFYGAFEGSLYDASEDRIVPAADITTDLYTEGDKLCSIAGDGIYPKVNEQRPEYRAAAAQRGAGWFQETFWFRSAVQMLYAIEYADFNSQSMIGNGRTGLSGGDWVADSYIGKCGLSLSDGNATNAVQNGGAAGYLTDYMTYRGIENFYGNVWQFIDGIAWDGRWTGDYAAMPVYVSNNPADFEDEQQGNMHHLCDASYIGSNAGYISDVEDCNGFIPKTAGGSSSTKLADYYWQYYESARDYWRSVLVGANASGGGSAGVFALLAAYGVPNDFAAIGGRLCGFGEEE